jgi:hypothetical protein
MKLHTLLSYLDEATRDGDLTDTSPVFAVVRNDAVAITSPEAWSAVSIVAVAGDAENRSVDLTADESDDATDITVASLRKRVRALGKDAADYRLYVGMASQPQDASGETVDVPVVEAYGDEAGLGLMVWFEGYDAWSQAQE